MTVTYTLRFLDVINLMIPIGRRGPRNGELSISMAECEGLALMTLARIGK